MKDNKTTYTVKLEFTDVDAKNPLEATKKIHKWIDDEVIYDVQDENTLETFTVNLSEENKYAVLPNNDIEGLKVKHEKIRNILINYGCEEHGDIIIDEISEAVGIKPTTIYYKEK